MKKPIAGSFKMDLSLDEIVTLKKKRGSNRGRGRGRGGVQKVTRGGGKIQSIKNKPGVLGAPIQKTRPVTERLGIPIKTKTATVATVGKPGGDLRDVLASKTKKQVVDLRAKIKPKMSPVTVSRGRGRGQRGGRMSAPIPSRRARSRSPIRKPYPPMGFSSPPLPPHGPSMRRQRESPVRLPSSAETKKITVTVPGLNRPVSEHSQGLYRREEHVAAAIQRSKESRHDTFLRGREEVLAQAITSALGGGGGMEREPAVGSGGYAPRMQMRYNRSPSTSMDPPLTGGYGGQHHAPPPPPPPPLSRSKGITTMTTMTISNLSDTVSKNDIAELCGAVGSLETVSMAAPGVAEVVFKYKDDALEAFKKYNQRNLDGQPMICKLQATSRGRAMHGGGGGYGSSGMRGSYMDSYTSDFNSYSSSFY